MKNFNVNFVNDERLLTKYVRTPCNKVCNKVKTLTRAVHEPANYGSRDLRL